VNDDAIKVWALAGSLRKDSWNRRLLDATAALAPYDIEITISELLPEIPMFNQDLIGNEPAVVQALRAEVAAADAVLIATPEYNGGVPGVLKNALDWITFPLGNSVMHEKPVALMGASVSKLGTARAQFEIRNTFVFTRSLVVPSPEVLLGFAGQAFDEDGNLTDAICVDRIESLLGTLKRYARLSAAQSVVLA
jgi:chromate reductase, NAD(P)H dehydrogenase (quinone)